MTEPLKPRIDFDGRRVSINRIRRCNAGMQRSTKRKTIAKW